MSKGGFTGVEIKGGEHVLCIILAYVKGDKCRSFRRPWEAQRTARRRLDFSLTAAVRKSAHETSAQLFGESVSERGWTSWEI